MIQQYIIYLRSIRGYSPNTCRAYEHDLRQFVSYIQQHTEGMRWSTITRTEIDKYIIHLRAAGNTAKTTNRALSSISGIYNYFIREGLTKSNPCKYESRAKMAETIPNVIPIEDIVKAYEKAQGLTRTMIGLLATTGIRIQELLDMSWEDIDFENQRIKIHGKGNRERVVITTANVLAPLKKVADELPARGKMFYISQRRARYLLYNAIRPYTRAVKVSPHIIRHSYATELARLGNNAVAISKAMGHKRLDTTQRYINLAEVEQANKSLLNQLTNSI